ncbi:MAG: transporter substrate-binding domain-containing protein [Proteobacteria bacterium]|nr:transporter substrate-binding domain-containing protein [Pseudomonadota bacterium]
MTVSTASFGGERISVFTEQDYPLNYTDSGEDDGPIIGFATELVIAVLEEAGLEYEIKIGPWVRAVQAIDSEENVLVYSMARSPARENRYHWIGEINPLDYYLYGLKANIDRLPRSLDEAADFRIGVTRGYAMHKYFAEKNFERLSVARNPAITLNMLKRGRVDLVPMSRLSVGMIANRYGIDRADLIGVIRLVDIATSTNMALSQNTKAETVSRLQAAYARIRASGRYDEIMGPLISLMEDNQVDILATGGR